MRGEGMSTVKPTVKSRGNTYVVSPYRKIRTSPGPAGYRLPSTVYSLESRPWTAAAGIPRREENRLGSTT